MSDAHAWFALQTMPRNEKKVDYLLRQKGYECFVPIYRQKRKWSDRTVEIDLPLFPTYVFCHINPSVLGKVIVTQGVTRIAGFGGKPAEIAVEKIEALQLLTSSNFLRWNPCRRRNRSLSRSSGDHMPNRKCKAIDHFHNLIATVGGHPTR